MAHKKAEGYLSSAEARKIARENRRVTDRLERRANGATCRRASTLPK